MNHLNLVGLALVLPGLLVAAFGARRWLKRMAGRLRIEAVEAERRRIARELHDTASQSAAGLRFQIECAMRCLCDDPFAAEAHLEQAVALAQSINVDLRRSVWHLHPRALDGRSLVSAMADTIRRTTTGTGVRVDFDVIGMPRSLVRSMESHLLRAQQEALANALKHASAQHVRIELIYERRSVRVRVVDDGQGFDSGARCQTRETGFGLEGMRERARQLGGELTIRRPSRGGTEVILEAPVRRRAEASRRLRWRGTRER